MQQHYITHYTDNIYPCWPHHHVQVYLVAGGFTGAPSYSTIDSTEVLTHGAQAWSYAGPLPRAMSGLRAVSIDNMVISTGEIILDITHNCHVIDCNCVQEAPEPAFSCLTPPPWLGARWGSWRRRGASTGPAWSRPTRSSSSVASMI